jgi:hypothetical protein
VRDIDRVEPTNRVTWPKLVGRRRREDEEPGRGHSDADELDADEQLEEDEEGHQHIDVRV